MKLLAAPTRPFGQVTPPPSPGGRPTPRLLSLLAVLALVITSCAQGEQGSEAASTGEVDRDATLRVAHVTAASSWDPHRVTSDSGAVPFMYTAYDRLIEWGRDGQPQPMLAEEWAVSDDVLSVTMSLRTDVTFWDGEKFNADAAKASLERGKRLLGPASGAELDTIESVEVVDDSTIKINLSTPDPSLFVKLASYGGMMISPKAVANDDLATTPSGSGPYIPNLEKSTDTVVVFDRNDKYWNDDAIKNKSLEIHTINDDQTKLNALRTGEIDLAYFAPSSYSQVKSAVTAGSGLELYTADDTQYAIGVNVNAEHEPAMKDPAVRRALSLAIDRKAIADSLLYGQCTPHAQPFGPGVIGHIDGLDEDPYDPDKARDMLRAAGHENLSLTILVPTVEPFKSVGEVLQRQWASIGVQASVRALPGEEFGAAFVAGQGEVSIGAKPVGPVPARALAHQAARGFIGTVPTWLTDLTTKVYALPQDGPEAEDAYKEIATRLNNEPLSMLICRPSEIILARDNVLGADKLMWSKFSTTFDPRYVGIAKEGG
ncbi:MAG: hypothetical protein GEV28_06715 [Actinophytocola sp.]|uniref:ABC transporter substrate-binding protein n=1 Tax=Actinophytocola sp. TaxID=1872138 RepID=UPI0013247531|nr:ABC transporter substrate-binding protein [Actinophytocola sp.]MPZ80088.1 hypothetical protein [Actinophytocola sp.]